MKEESKKQESQTNKKSFAMIVWTKGTAAAKGKQ